MGFEIACSAARAWLDNGMSVGSDRRNDGLVSAAPARLGIVGKGGVDPFAVFPRHREREKNSMSQRRRGYWADAAVIGLVLIGFATTFAGNNNYRVGAVGGVEVDPQGVLKNATVDSTRQLAEARQGVVGRAPKSLSEKTELRKVSLRKLQETIEEHLRKGEALPDAVKYLGGLQRIRYVFVYPEENDIVLAGPGEGWKVEPNGFVVGETTGRPVLQLDDLINALRLSSRNAQQPITCSIDPTKEGYAKLQQYLTVLNGRMTPDAVNGIEQSLGPQEITFGNLTASSRLAMVLIAADYRMKRYAMGFEACPVAGIGSFVGMNVSAADTFPRWWMTTNYDALLRTEAGDAWELRGQGVKTMTEDSFFEKNGKRTATGKANPAAQKWADNMTKKFEALADRVPVFGELRNVMDVAVIATLITSEDLAGKAGMSLDVFLKGQIPLVELPPAKTVPTQAHLERKGSRVIISASGGVEILPLSVIRNTEMSSDLAPIRNSATADKMNWKWYWN